jgi:hypothetical protein
MYNLAHALHHFNPRIGEAIALIKLEKTLLTRVFGEEDKKANDCVEYCSGD